MIITSKKQMKEFQCELMIEIHCGAHFGDLWSTIWLDRIAIHWFDGAQQPGIGGEHTACCSACELHTTRDFVQSISQQKMKWKKNINKREA